MTSPIVHQRPMLDEAIHATRFVTPYPDTFKGGRLMYRDGKRRDLCTATQVHGFDFEENRCADMYWASMIRASSDSRRAPKIEEW
jgi:hypothetical protein